VPTKRKPKLEVVKPEPAAIEGLPFTAQLEDLQRWYRLNKRAEVARMRLINQNESFVAFQIGYNAFLPDDERKTKLKQVEESLARYEKGEPMGLPGGEEMDEATAEMMRASQPAIDGLIAAEKKSRRAMEKIVAKLPGGDCAGWAGDGWIDATKGVSLYGYGCILGLLGDPRQFELEDGTVEKTTPQGLRRYIGLAPKNSYARADDGEGAAMRPGNKLAVLYFKITLIATDSAPSTFFF
jgi:hypothetical protein